MDTNLKNRWYSLSLPEQMVNIGNEVKRAIRFEKDETKKAYFLNNALEFTDLSISDPKNKSVIEELIIGKEVLLDYSFNHCLDISTDQLNNYYQSFQYLIS